MVRLVVGRDGCLLSYVLQKVRIFSFLVFGLQVGCVESMEVLHCVVRGVVDSFKAVWLRMELVGAIAILHSVVYSFIDD